MLLIDWIHLGMALLFVITAIQKLLGRQGEHFYTRLVNGAWFGLTVIDREMPVDVVRIFSTSLILIMLSVEASSPIFRRYYRGKI